jgi:hypothetical protein
MLVLGAYEHARQSGHEVSTGSHLHDCCIYTFCASTLAAPIATFLLTSLFAGAALNDIKLKVFSVIFFSGVVAGEEINSNTAEEEYSVNKTGNLTDYYEYL